MKKFIVLVLCEWIFVVWKNIFSDYVLYNFKKYCFLNNLYGSEDCLRFDIF